MAAFGIEAARQHYDRLGAAQDRELRYAAPAFETLLRLDDFQSAHRVIEFGCGTGFLAELLLKHALPADARYLGLDLSQGMLDVATHRLAAFGERVALKRTDGSVELPAADGTVDLVVATYVLDLLSGPAIDRFLLEAHRVLKPDGRLALAALGRGTTVTQRLRAAAWSAVHLIAPARVGGCRPLHLGRRLAGGRWQVAAHAACNAAGIASELLIVRPDA